MYIYIYKYIYALLALLPPALTRGEGGEVKLHTYPLLPCPACLVAYYL